MVIAPAGHGLVGADPTRILGAGRNGGEDTVRWVHLPDCDPDAVLAVSPAVDGSVGMLRVPMIILAALYFAFSGFTAVVGAFADGGTIPERIVVSLAHPAAAILLLMAVSFPKPISTGLRKFTLVLLLVAIAADLVLAVLIGLGVVKGDWFLPLVFAVVPVVGVAYLAGGGRQDHPRSA